MILHSAEFTTVTFARFLRVVLVWKISVSALVCTGREILFIDILQKSWSRAGKCETAPEKRDCTNWLRGTATSWLRVAYTVCQAGPFFRDTWAGVILAVAGVWTQAVWLKVSHCRAESFCHPLLRYQDFKLTALSSFFFWSGLIPP